MFTIMQSNVIRTQVFVPQDQAFGLGPGVEAVVRVPEIPNRSFPGKVTRIADALQPDTRTMLTEIDIPNRDGGLAAGILFLVELHILRKRTALLVQAEAIIFNRDGVLVAVVEDGIAHIRKVRWRATWERRSRCAMVSRQVTRSSSIRPSTSSTAARSVYPPWAVTDCEMSSAVPYTILGEPAPYLLTQDRVFVRRMDDVVTLSGIRAA